MNKLKCKEIALQNLWRQNKSVQPVFDSIASVQLHPEFLVIHRIPFADTSYTFNIVIIYQDKLYLTLIRF